MKRNTIKHKIYIFNGYQWVLFAETTSFLLPKKLRELINIGVQYRVQSNNLKDFEYYKKLLEEFIAERGYDTPANFYNELAAELSSK